TQSGYAGYAQRCLRIAAWSGIDGRFSLPFVRGEEFIAARKVGYGASWSHPIQQLGDGDIELRLGSKAAAMSGDVVDSDGRPMPNVSVVVEPMESPLRRGLDGTLLAPRLGLITRTDAAGRFVVEGLAPEAYQVVALMRPHQSDRQRLR